MDSTLIDVIINNIEDNPHCFHGPTLLFNRLKGKTKTYFACAACRDRKYCNFFLAANTDDISRNKLSDHWKKQREEVLGKIKSDNIYIKYKKILKFHKESLNLCCSNKKNSDSELNAIQTKAGFCYDCDCLFNDKSHNHCNVQENLTMYLLLHPTEIILPKIDTKTHAQYFFSKDTLNDLALLLTRLSINKILCIGTPRIHEFVLNNLKDQIKSILLDIDKTYFNFYSKNKFIWYNMFNNFIFDEEQKGVLLEHLNSDKVLVLLDPPFGGRVEPLANTLKLLNKMPIKLDKNSSAKKGNQTLKIFWFFPYFMEQHILRSLPHFKMFDYKVNYENHSSFTNVGKRKRKFGSPVRIFTNIPLSHLDLSNVSGYKFCKLCNNWVSNENRHCSECNNCTSKDGRTYIHCHKCSRCVKPTYKHCITCNRCCLSEHICGQFQPDPNCFHCHQPGHKKASCPQIKNNILKKSGKKLPRKKQKVK